MLSIVFLVLGIIGFVKGHIAVSKTRELRGAWMYVVCSLLCIPLPLSFLAGIVLGVIFTARNEPIPEGPLLIAGVVCGWGPVIAAIIIGWIKGQPKIEATTQRGFDVSRPPPPPR